MSEDFEYLLGEALADPERADFVALREAYARSESYVPFGREHEEIEILHQHMAAEEWGRARSLCEELLDHDPLSITLRFAYAHILEAEDDEWEASDQRMFANGLLRGILRSGDGRTPETAFAVLDTREMFLVVEVLGLRVIRSQLSHVDGLWLDTVEARGPEGDRTLYFDVTLPQEWLADVHKGS